MFGGHLTLIITGSAPIDPRVSTFFQVCLSIHVADIYGQTEAGP